MIRTTGHSPGQAVHKRLTCIQDVAALINGGGLPVVAAMIPFGGGGRAGMTRASQKPCYATHDGVTAVISGYESFAQVRKELGQWQTIR